LEGSVSYTFQESKNRDEGNSMVNSPKHLAKLNLSIPVFKDRWTLGLQQLYTSSRRTLSRDTANDFFLTNLTLFGNKIVKGLDISAGVYNLFDHQYDDPGAEEHLQDAIEQDGRTYRLKITYRF